MNRPLPNDIFFREVETLLAEGREVEILLRGNSMRPLLHEGDRIVLAPCRGNALRAGDVVLFRWRAGYVLHRIVRRDGDSFVLAGDGNLRRRETCRSADIAARLEKVVRPSGRIVACASRRWRCASRLWLLLPVPLRRLVLHMLH